MCFFSFLTLKYKPLTTKIGIMNFCLSILGILLALFIMLEFYLIIKLIY